MKKSKSSSKILCRNTYSISPQLDKFALSPRIFTGNFPSELSTQSNVRLSKLSSNKGKTGSQFFKPRKSIPKQDTVRPTESLRLITEPEILVKRHRKILLEIFKLPDFKESLTPEIVEMLVELPNFSDELSLLVSSLLTLSDDKATSYENAVIEVLSKELTQKGATISQLMKENELVCKSNKELTEMVLSLNKESKVSLDFSKFMTQTFSTSQPMSNKRKATRVACKATENKRVNSLFLSIYQADSYEDSFELLVKQSQALLKTDEIVLFRPNSKQTKFRTFFRNSMKKIHSNQSILSAVCKERKIKALKEGDPDFDLKIEYSLGCKAKAMLIGPVSLQNSTTGALVAMKILPLLPPEEDFSVILGAFGLLEDYWHWRRACISERRASHTILSTLISVLDPEEPEGVIETIKKSIFSVIGISRLNILFPSFDKKTLQRTQFGITSDVFSTEEGLAGACAESGTVLISNNVPLDKRFRQNVDDPEGLKTKRILTAPLYSNGALLAVFQLINKTDKSEFSVYEGRLVHLYCKLVTLVTECLKVKVNLMRVQKRMRKVENVIFDLGK